MKQKHNPTNSALVTQGELRLDLERNASFLVTSLASKLAASASATYMRHFGVGVMEWRVIAMVKVRPGITANEVSQISGVDKSSVSRATQSLTRRGLVEATADSTDNRRNPLFLTDAGYALHDRIIVLSLEREATLLGGLSAEERELLLRLLRRLMVNTALLSARKHDGPETAAGAAAPGR